MTAFTADTLATLTGIAVGQNRKEAIFAGLPPLSVAHVDAKRRAEITAEVETVIRERRFRVIGDQDDQAIWNKGWGEVAQQIAQANTVSLETLKPQYFHPGVPIRYLGEYVVPEMDYFEYYTGIAVRRQLMLAAFPTSKRLVELGCGTGMNLILAANLYPAADLAGSDWTQPTLDILRAMGRALNRNISGHLYNMLTGEGRDGILIDGDTDVLTCHALEQLGDKAPAVIEWLIDRRPGRCLHIEPIFEFYDRSKPFDDIAARYHLARGYLQGLVPTLDRAAANGRIEITDRGRVQLGNTYHEAYSYICWRSC